MACRRMGRSWPTATAAVFLILLSATACAVAAPTISNISLRGLQIGGITTIVIEGSDLLPDPRLMLPVPIAAQSVKSDSTAERVEIEVSLDGSVEPGIYPLRLASGRGISPPVAVGLDQLAQRSWTTEITALPVALHGTLTGTQIVRTTLMGKKDQRLVVAVEARRLGAGLNPVVRLLDDRDVQLAWSAGRGQIAGDARLELVLPRDGKYTIRLHDGLYRGATPGHFRLKIGSLHYADLVYPLGVTLGEKTALEFAASNLPATTAVLVESVDQPGERPAPWPSVDGISGGRPRLVVSQHAEYVEQAVGGGPVQEIPAAPVGMNGRLAATGEQDKFLLAVTPGEKLRLEVFAGRFGSPLDAVLNVLSEQGETLASADDQPGTSDPGLDLTIPEATQHVVVEIKDLHDRGGLDFVYRIAITPTDGPDFDLALDTDTINTPTGGTALVKVRATRRGYQGPIELSVKGLPEGLVLAGDEIPAGADAALLTLTAPDGGSSSPPRIGRIVGRSAGPEQIITRMAKAAPTSVTQYQPWLRDRVGLAVRPPVPISIAWHGEGERELVQGTNFAAKVKLSRADGGSGSLRLALVTSQTMPKRTVRKNNRDQQVDDSERTLRLAGTPTFGKVTDATVDETVATVNLIVPPDLPQKSWDHVLKAELLSDDGKKVVATAITPVRRLTVIGALSLNLSGSSAAEAKAGLGKTGSFTGRIHRHPSFKHPVTVTLQGLPEGYEAPQVTVRPESNDFMLPVRFKYGAKATELKDVKLVATSQTIAERADLLVRSNQALVTITVVPGQKPAAEKKDEKR